MNLIDSKEPEQAKFLNPGTASRERVRRVYSGNSTRSQFARIHRSDFPGLSQTDGVQGQKAHPIQQRTDGCDLSLRELRHRDQADNQRLLGPTEIDRRFRPRGRLVGAMVAAWGVIE